MTNMTTIETAIGRAGTARQGKEDTMTHSETLAQLRPEEIDQLAAIGEGAAAIDTLAEIDPLLRALAAGELACRAWAKKFQHEYESPIQSVEKQREWQAVYPLRRDAEAAILRYALAYVAARDGAEVTP